MAHGLQEVIVQDGQAGRQRGGVGLLGEEQPGVQRGVVDDVAGPEEAQRRLPAHRQLTRDQPGEHERTERPRAPRERLGRLEPALRQNQQRCGDGATGAWHLVGRDVAGPRGVGLQQGDPVGPRRRGRRTVGPFLEGHDS
jgi:hypothetical protein